MHVRASLPPPPARSGGMANPVAFVEEIDEDEFEEEEYDEDDDFDGAEFDDYEAGDEEDDEEDEEDEDGLDGSEAADAPQDGVQGEVDDAHRLQGEPAHASARPRARCVRGARTGQRLRADAPKRAKRRPRIGGALTTCRLDCRGCR